MVLMLKQCCCGCTLKTGTLIIAVVFAILAGLQVVMYSVYAVDVSDSYDHLHGLWEEIEQEEMLTTTLAPVTSVEGHQQATNDTSGGPRNQHSLPLATHLKLILVWKWCAILLSITETIDFFLDICLMFAANKDSARHVLIWLFGFFGTSSCRLILHFVVMGAIFYVDAVIAGFVVLTIACLIAVGAAYSFLVVVSYYRHLVGTGIARRISRQGD